MRLYCRVLRSSLAIGLLILLFPLWSFGLTAPQLPPGRRTLSLPGYLRGSRKSHASQVIVFVHGVFGNGLDTWTNAHTGAYFPQLLADDSTFDEADIWVYEYPTPRFGRSYSVDELADHLRRHLQDDEVIANHQQIIFVSHSMGGLVVRAYLLKYRDELSPVQVPMLYFFATPTTGADIANIAHLLSKNPQLGDMRKMRTGDSGVLATWDAQWSSSKYWREVPSYCAYETLQTRGIQIVQRESAEHLCNRRLDPIAADHVDIAKPAGPRDESFIALRDAYREVFRKQRGLLRRPPAFNLSAHPPSLVQGSTSSSDPSCNGCWSPEVSLEATQRVFVRIHYENDGGMPAHRVKVRLDTPSDLLSDPLVVASLSSDEVGPMYGAACIGSPAGPIVFLPERAEWYPNNAKSALPLPYGQSVEALTSAQGLDLGDLSAGAEFSSDLVVTLRALPIVFASFRHAEQWLERVEPMLEKRGGLFDMSELAKFVTIDDLKPSRARLDFTDALEARGLVSDLDQLTADEVVITYVLVHNEFSTRLHSVRLWLRKDETEEHLRVSAVAKETSFEIARLHISYAQGAKSLGCELGMRLPPGFCQEIHSIADAMKLPRDEDASDGIDIGDLDPEDTAVVLLFFEVH